MIPNMNAQTHFWCEQCGRIQPVSFEGFTGTDVSEDFIGGDILCDECHFIIATMYKRLEL